MKADRLIILGCLTARFLIVLSSCLRWSSAWSICQALWSYSQLSQKFARGYLRRNWKNTALIWFEFKDKVKLASFLATLVAHILSSYRRAMIYKRRYKHCRALHYTTQDTITNFFSLHASHHHISTSFSIADIEMIGKMYLIARRHGYVHSIVIRSEQGANDNFRFKMP